MPYHNAKLYKKKVGRPRKGYTKTGAKRGRPPKGSATSVPQSVKTFVKRAIDRNVENKTKNYFNTGALIYPSSSANMVASIVPVSPYASYLEMSQGTGQGNRVGNAIYIKRLWLKGTIFPRPYDATSNPSPEPSRVIFWFFYDKTATTTIPAPGSDFLQQGNSTVALQNQLSDCWCPINTDKYRLLAKRVFKLGFANNGGTGNSAANQSFANNDFKLNHDFTINLTDKCIRKVRYNDNNTTPSTRGLYWMYTVVSSTGGGYGASRIPAEMEYSLNVSYEDA